MGNVFSSKKAFVKECVCNYRYDTNCAHFLSNWMINNGYIKEYPTGANAYCSRGRPIRAKEMRDVFKNMGLKMHYNNDGRDCYIYCERNSDHQGHVYYGRKGKCVAGTGDGGFGADYYEYYY